MGRRSTSRPVSGATIESLYVSFAAARRGVGSSLLAHAERQIRDAGASVAYLDASPNAEAFYARRGYRRVGAGQGEQFNSHEQTARSVQCDMAGMEADFEIREGGRATIALSVAFRAAPKRVS